MVFSLIVLLPVAVLSQTDTCSEIVRTALEATENVCDSAGRNEACYGHVMLEAEPQGDVDDFRFSEVGDVARVDEIGSLRLSPMDEIAGTWGVALMRLQADIPDEKPQNVTVLLFGDVEIDNMVPMPTAMDVTVATSGNVNVRRMPSNFAFVENTLTPGQTITATGRSEDNNWLYVTLPDGSTGWVSNAFMLSPGDTNDLNVIRPDLTNYGPMQAFYLQTGQETSRCSEVPNDGILVQTPDGVAEIRLWINEVKIRLGSTAFITAGANNSMVVNTIEGTAHVEALGVESVAVAGTTVSVPLNKDLKPIAPPSDPVAYTEDVVESLPVDNLDREITIEPPLEVTDEVTPTETATDVPTATDTPTETATDVPTATDTPTDVPTATAVTTEEASPTDSPVPPTEEPTAVQTEEPTAAPTDSPVQPTGDAGDTSDSNPPPSTEEGTSDSSNDDASSGSTETPEPTPEATP
jgi:hypothetical protein